MSNILATCAAIEKIEIIALHPTEIDGEPNDSLDYDYYGVSVEVNGHEVQRFGDACHDKGIDKAEGFVQGLIAGFSALGKQTVTDFSRSSRLDASVNC